MLKRHDARPGGAPDAVSWTARVRWEDGLARGRSRGHGLDVLAPVRFTAGGDVAPASLDVLLCALGGEIVAAFAAVAARANLTLDALEAAVTAQLENPLVAAGVIGELGSPAIATARVTLFVSSPDREDDLRHALDRALARCPLQATLGRACAMGVDLRIVP